MIPELQTASRIVCQRLRQRPYQPGVTITAWKAVIEQVIDGRRGGAFSWNKALATEVYKYIAELSEDSKRRIWESTEDSELLPNASINTITEGLYPFVFNAALSRIYRSIRRRKQRERENNSNHEE